MKVLNHWKLKCVARNLAEGVPRAITVTSDEITQAISDPLQSIVSAVKSALEQTPPEFLPILQSVELCSPVAVRYCVT